MLVKNLLDGREIFALFESGDASAVFHDMACFWLGELREAQSCPASPAWAREMWGALEEAYGFDRETADSFQWNNVREWFAFEFECYLRDGKAPVRELESAFGQIREWIADICGVLSDGKERGKIQETAKLVRDIMGEGERKVSVHSFPAQ